jgi:uncharacterized repeat protein (TIGR01451 family)
MKHFSLVACSLLFCSFATAQAPSVALVQQANKDAGTTTSSSLAFPANNAASNWIAVVLRAGKSGAAFTVSDSRGNTYRQAVQLNVTVDTPHGDTLAIFYAENVTAGANTVMVSDSLSGASLRFAIFEYSGVALANSLDGAAAAQGTNAAPASGNTTTTASGDLLLGAVMTADARTFTPGSGFAIRAHVPAPPGAKLIAQDRIQPSAGAASAGATLNLNNPWGAIVAAFRPAPVGGQPDLTLAKTHAGSFVQGQSGATYTLTVSNSGSAATVGTVNVTDTLPVGLTATGMSGTNWSCTVASRSCTRTDALAGGASYPPITLTVSVASNAPASVTNTASVSGGGEQNTGNNAASDVTSIGPAAAPDLTLAKTHAGSFVQGQSGATYTLTVSNSGSAATVGTVTVTDTLPAGLTATGISGAGWSCTVSPTRCTRADALTAAGSYPSITLTVSVAANAPASVTNTASVSGGGELNTANNAASDVTAIGSGTDTQLPTTPGSLTAAAPTGSRIDLNWAAASDNIGVTGYRVEQCAGAGCTGFTEIAQVDAGTAGMGPLTASANPNYFKDASGRPIILNGSHTWNTLQDWGTNGSPQVFDFNAFVNFLVAHGHNYTLLWYVEVPKFCGLPTTASSPPDITIGPHPWQRTGPGIATDGQPKFDLTKFNQAYFDRLRSRAQALNDAGIYVGVYTFTGEFVWTFRCSTDGYPFTGTNNINGINDGGGDASFTMTSPNAITALQDAYVEKVIDTLNDLPNVLWIVSEEAPPDSAWWNAHQIAHIRSYESTKPLRHPIGYAVLGYGNNATLFNSDADWVAGASKIAPTTSCGNGTPTCKVHVNDSDHPYFGMWNDSAQVNRNYAWQNFTNGNQVLFMDPYVLHYPREGRNLCASPINGICPGPDARWDNFRDNLGDILRYSRKLNLANVMPRGSLTSTSNCLAQTPSIGAEYLVYAPNGGSFTVNLSAMSSSRMLNVEWFNPATGATTVVSPIAAGSSSQSFTPPFAGDAVLYLVDAAGHAGAVPVATSYSVTGLATGTYRYRVRAEDAAGNLGPYSNIASATIQGPDTQPPTAPGGLTATTPAAGQIGLSWTTSTDDRAVTGYLVERCQGAGCTTFVQVAAPSGTGTTILDTGLAASTSYAYRVRATDAANNLGPYSNITAATTLSAPAGISLVQHRSLDAGSAASSSLAFSSTNGAGNWIGVAIRSAPSGQALTVTDTRGNTYRKAIQLNETVDNIAIAIYYAENIAGGSNTVTVSRPQAGGPLRFAIVEYSGVALSGSLDKAASAQGSSATPNSGSVTPAFSGDLVIGAVATANERTFTAGSGYVIEERVPAAPYTKLILEDRTQSTASPVSAGATLSASDVWGAVIAAFRAR